MKYRIGIFSLAIVAAVLLGDPPREPVCVALDDLDASVRRAAVHDEVLEVRRGVYEARALDSTYSARVVALNDVLSQFARAIVTDVAAVTD